MIRVLDNESQTIPRVQHLSGRTLKSDVRGEKLGDLDLDGLGQERPRTVAQNLGQRIDKTVWLGKLENVSLGHGVSLLRWRSGGVELPPRYAALPSHAVTNFRP
jgi:hypothetical protein